MRRSNVMLTRLFSLYDNLTLDEVLRSFWSVSMGLHTHNPSKIRGHRSNTGQKLSDVQVKTLERWRKVYRMEMRKNNI